LSVRRLSAAIEAQSGPAGRKETGEIAAFVAVHRSSFVHGHMPLKRVSDGSPLTRVKTT
jgi:hypothetical protein